MNAAGPVAGARRTVLVTGAARGLGLAVATALHGLGHRVLAGVRDERDGGRVAAGLGGDAVPLVLDVTDAASVARAARAAGPVDVVVNNAGVQLDWGTRPSSVALDTVADTFAVNLFGAWRVSQAFVPGMVERGWGRVVMVSSGAGSFTNGIAAQCAGYSVSKAALNALTATLGAELDGTGVLVNAVNPGLVRTRMRPDAPQSPEEAAEAVVHAALLPDDGPTGVLLRRGAVIGW
ncbi:SDR family oxidoreductase [Streptomyces griseorubiginosus]|uniref:SDR family NAD(P)-dependent oxidoreductase n=1 Tax=Streptomyces griseorubiginosus TaxID=67304 RepID=UPI0033A64EF0